VNDATALQAKTPHTSVIHPLFSGFFHFKELVDQKHKTTANNANFTQISFGCFLRCPTTPFV